MSVNNSIVNVGLSQMELLGKRLAAVATKFQCVVRMYVRIILKLCSNFYSVFENAPKKFCKSPDAYWTWTVVSSLFFSSVYFFSFFWKFCVRGAQDTPLDPRFSFPLLCFIFFPSSHIFCILSILFIAVHNELQFCGFFEGDPFDVHCWQYICRIERIDRAPCKLSDEN